METIRIYKKKAGSVIIVGMPIGNFEDLSPRAISTLNNCSVILCEDTRSSGPMLEYFNIHKPLISYVGSYEQAMKIAKSEIEQNNNVGLICDRGMVGISDPGAKLIAQFRKLSIKIDCVPGPSSLTTAFALSGYYGHFVFHGFLPRKHDEILQLINQLKHLHYSLIFFESAQRINESLKILNEAVPEREITIARELTKPHEQILQGKIADFIDAELKGECVLIIKHPE